MRVRFAMPDRFVAVPNEVVDLMAAGRISALALAVLVFSARHRTGHWLSVPEICRGVGCKKFAWQRARAELTEVGALVPAEERDARGRLLGAFFDLGWPVHRELGFQSLGGKQPVSDGTGSLVSSLDRAGKPASLLNTKTAALREAAPQLSGAERREEAARKTASADAEAFLRERGRRA